MFWHSGSNGTENSLKVRCHREKSDLLKLVGSEFGTLRQDLFQQEIGVPHREFLWVEVLAGPLAHLAVLLVPRLGENLDQFRIAIRTAGIFWRAGPCSVDNARILLCVRLYGNDVFEDHGVSPVVAEVIAIGYRAGWNLSSEEPWTVNSTVLDDFSRLIVIGVGHSVALTADLDSCRW